MAESEEFDVDDVIDQLLAVRSAKPQTMVALPQSTIINLCHIVRQVSEIARDSALRSQTLWSALWLRSCRHCR